MVTNKERKSKLNWWFKEGQWRESKYCLSTRRTASEEIETIRYFGSDSNHQWWKVVSGYHHTRVLFLSTKTTRYNQASRCLIPPKISSRGNNFTCVFFKKQSETTATRQKQNTDKFSNHLLVFPLSQHVFLVQNTENYL